MRARLVLLLVASSALGVAQAPQRAERGLFELFVDRAAYSWVDGGTTPSGVPFKTAPGPQTGVGFRAGWVLDPTKDWAWDFTAGLRVGGLSNVRFDGTSPGIAIRSGAQTSLLGGVMFRRNAAFEYGLGVEARITSLATGQEGEGTKSKVVATPWIRGMVGLWTNREGRYLRLEAGFNPLSRTFPERTYSNANWAPWADPSLTPATVTAPSQWEPKWYVGLAIGIRPSSPVRSTPPQARPGKTEAAPEVAAPVGVVAPPPAPVPVVELPPQAPQRPLQAPEVLPAPPVAPKGPETVFKVYFRSGEAVLTHEAIVVLRSWVKASREAGKSVKALRLVGHADARGEQQRNLALSEKRASAVRRYLEELGCPCEGVDAVGLGSGEPVATNKTPGGRAMNRRVEGVAFWIQSAVPVSSK